MRLHYNIKADSARNPLNPIWTLIIKISTDMMHFQQKYNKY